MSLPDGLEVRGSRVPPDSGDQTAPPTSSASSRGRSLYATRDFAPGALIAAFEEPLVVLPFGSAAAHTCNYCLDPRRPVKACTGCRAVAYCGSRCQRAHWAAVHKLECRALKKALAAADMPGELGKPDTAQTKTSAPRDTPEETETPPKHVPAPVRALLQILLRWPAVQDAVAGLEGNVDAFRQRKTLWDDFVVQASAACSFAGWTASDENMATATEVMCKIHTNSFDRSDPDVQYTGTFLDVQLAMANHSCVPNAVVVFAGRKAYLRAEQAISSGQEITISYIDYTKPKSIRQHGLDLYHFTCDCPRCKDNQDVYQVCRYSPLVPLNAFSFVPDTDVLRKPPLKRKAPAISAEQLDQIYAECQPEKPVSPDERLESLRHKWAVCQPLVRARRWAEEPLAHIFQQAIVYYSEQRNFAHALAMECFVAVRSDPYKYVAPFAQWRLKGLLLIAKTITNTTVDPSALSPSFSVHPEVQAVLGGLADGSLYEAILLMVLHYGPMGHSEEWELLAMARDMLQDVQSVKERELMSAALHHWIQDPTEAMAANFFRQNILAPVEHLANQAVEILRADLEPQSATKK